MADLIIRRNADNSEVHRIPVRNPTAARVAKVVSGLEQRIDLDHFHVDESETDQAIAQAATALSAGIKAAKEAAHG